MSAHFYIKHGDTLPVLSATLKASNGIVVVNADVEDVLFRFRNVTTDAELERDATDSGDNGIYTYSFVAGDWAGGQFDIGRYYFEAVLTMVGGDILTIPTRAPKVVEVTEPV